VPVDRIFTAGSLATSYDEIATWYGKHAADLNAKRVYMPFCGFGKIVSAICRDNVTIDMCDFQRISAALVEGVFAAPEWKTNVDKPRFHKGKACAGGLMRASAGPDQYCAGFIDWIVKYGTPLDVACIGMAIPGQTYRGWLTKWTGDFDHLYDKFVKYREVFKPFINMPGTWNFTEADFFKLQPKEHYDLLVVDPPSLHPTQDLYSNGWKKINAVLGGEVRIKPWTDRNYFTLLRQVAAVKSDYLLLTWSKGNPPTEQIKNFVLSQGTLEDEVLWESRKDIYGWRIRREVPAGPVDN
jgi:hypothetical protein